jgi:hypothetical protein
MATNGTLVYRAADKSPFPSPINTHLDLFEIHALNTFSKTNFNHKAQKKLMFPLFFLICKRFFRFAELG